MNNTPGDPQKLFAKQIEEEIKARFHDKAESEFQMETLEDAKDSYKLEIQEETDPLSSTRGDDHCFTERQVTVSPDIKKKIVAERFADSVIHTLLAKAKTSENIIFVTMTPLIFSETHDDNRGEWVNHISYRYRISEFKIKEQ